MSIASTRTRRAIRPLDDDHPLLRARPAPGAAAEAPGAARDDINDDRADAASSPGWHASSWALRAGLEVHEADIGEWQACRDALQQGCAAVGAQAADACQR